MKNTLRIIIAITFIIVPLLCACSAGNSNPGSPAPTTGLSTQNSIPGASPNEPSTPPLQSGSPTPGADEAADPDASTTMSGQVVISFDYEKISGSASNQYAIWIEDMDGNYINTVFATQWTATGGWKTRPDSIALWVEKSGITSMPEYYIDAISGATPKATSRQTYSWNLRDINGEAVAPGEYRFFVEGTLRWKNYVLYSGTITIGNSPNEVQAAAEYFYKASDKNAALTSDSPENRMISNVIASFFPDVNR